MGIKHVKAKEKNNLQKTALDNTLKPMTQEQIAELTPMTLETFKDNIGKLFPVVLARVASGQGIRALEREWGMKTRVLETFIQRHPRLDKAVKAARKLSVDKQHELKFLLS